MTLILPGPARILRAPAELAPLRRPSEGDTAHEGRLMPPVWAADYITPSGVPFTLVREQEWADATSGICAFQLRREEGWVGFIHTTYTDGVVKPFSTVGHPLATVATTRSAPELRIWRAFLTDGRDVKAGMLGLPSRRLGIMSTAYIGILVQLAMGGWVLGANRRAQLPEARRLWRALERQGVPIGTRRRDGKRYTYAYLLADHLAHGQVA